MDQPSGLAELAVEAVDRARGGEHSPEEGRQLGARSPGRDDLGLGLLAFG